MDVLSFPVSVILAAAFCVGSYLTYGFYKRSALLSGRPLTITCMAVVALLSMIEGIWKFSLQHTILFWIPVLVTTWLAGMTTMDAIRNRLRLSFILAHCGLFLIFFGAFFGAPDFDSAVMAVTKSEPRSYAVSDRNLTVPLPFSIQLTDFRIDFYGDSFTPKQYTSVLELSDGTLVQKETSVNHPCYHKGWLIYQSDYDYERGDYSVIRLVRDPWLPIIFLGMALLAVGSVLGLRGTWKSKAVIPSVLVLALVFGGLSIARISLATLAPALRSLWFIPHLIIYMIAYALLAIALVCSVIGLFKNIPSIDATSRKLLATSSSLLLVGMLCGAVWAKSAWGDYWTWDPKECWAAATWLITLTGTHLCSKNKNLIFVAILLAFLSMQITWYGVNWLPSSQFSMHTYNS